MATNATISARTSRKRKPRDRDELACRPLPSADAEGCGKLLSDYANQRILFYTNTDDAQRTRIDERSINWRLISGLQVRGTLAAQRDARCRPGARRHERFYQLAGLYAGAYWNRILRAAWYLLAAIHCAATCCLATGCKRRASLRSAAAPSSRFPALIADIDAPRHGLIHVSRKPGKSARSLGH